MPTNDGVLAGLKVIDCATYVAGPAAATVMSDFGADVMPEGAALADFGAGSTGASDATWIGHSGIACSENKE